MRRQALVLGRVVAAPAEEELGELRQRLPDRRQFTELKKTWIVGERLPTERDTWILADIGRPGGRPEEQRGRPFVDRSRRGGIRELWKGERGVEDQQGGKVADSDVSDGIESL